MRIGRTCGLGIPVAKSLVMLRTLARHAWIPGLVALLAVPALAQTEATDPRFTGRYRFDGSAEDGRARVIRAVRPTLGRLNPILRAAAMERLNESRPVPHRIDLGVRGERIRIRYHGAERTRAFESQSGHPRQVEGEQWEARMTQLFRQGRLEQVFEAHGGRWYNVFTLDESGERLTLRVVLSGGRLPETIQLELPYRRVH